eukprot:TRINITY_DN31_c1_g1_i3.p3 TRINITY_DN31_c1_g1~~TRINITY_DN31_c1_g1_i3.p3  ORF type:complete len:545 (-),score=114.54 TRINITY_DN31_c1_g1_i3:3860-5494(-)
MYPKKSPLIAKNRAQTTPTRLASYYSVRPREQVKNILLSKYRVKYGAIKQPELESVIKQEVESLMRREKVYQSHLQTLERRIKSLVSRSVDRSCHGKVTDVPNNKPVPSGMNASLIVQSENKRLDESTNSLLPSINKSQIISASKNQWAKIIEYDLVKYKEDIQKEAELQNAKKQRIRAELDRQIREKAYAREIAKKAEYEKDLIMINQAKVQEDLEARKVTEIRKKTIQERSLRDKQRQEEYERKRKEREQELLSEKEQLEKLRAEMQKELASIQTKRQKELENAKQVLEENEKNKKLRENEKRKEHEVEKEMIRKHQKMLEEQEKKRFEEFKAKEARIQAFLKLTADTVVKDDEMKRKEEEQKLIKNLIEREQKERQEEENKKRLWKEKERSMKSYLDSQVKEKREMLAMEKDRNKEIAKIWESKAKEHLEKEKVEVEKKKLKQKQLRSDIIKQIIEKRENLSKGIEMSQIEEAINKKILENASSLHGSPSSQHFTILLPSIQQILRIISILIINYATLKLISVPHTGQERSFLKCSMMHLS